MKTLSMKHELKTNKSIYNILIGKKSHQTYFDATIEHLKLYYGCLPNLKYHHFESIIENGSYSQYKPIKANTFYEQAYQTIQTILLVIQMVSHKKHDHSFYQPIINDKSIQFKAKELYIFIKNDKFDLFINEIYELLEEIENEFNTVYVHYLLTGFGETPYTIEQISLLEHIPVLELKSQLIQEFQYIQKCLENSEKYPILSKIKFEASLNYQTLTTFQLLNQTTNIERLAELKNVKTHTIHDHIIEMYIKGYLIDKSLYIDDETYVNFIEVFEEKPNQNLKYYYEKLENLSYFEIKLMYVIYAMEEIYVKR